MWLICGYILLEIILFGNTNYTENKVCLTFHTSFFNVTLIQIFFKIYSPVDPAVVAWRYRRGQSSLCFGGFKSRLGMIYSLVLLKHGSSDGSAFISQSKGCGFESHWILWDFLQECTVMIHILVIDGHGILGGYKPRIKSQP